MKILIVKIGAIGDVITALPVVTNIRTKFPQSEITWVGGSIVAPILHLIPDINKVVVVNEKEIFSKKPLSIASSFFKLYRRIGFRHYGVILNYHVDWRYKLISLLSFSSKKFSFSRSGDRPIPKPGRNRVYEHIRLFQKSDDHDDQIISFPTFYFDKIDVKDTISHYFGPSTIVLSPGGAKNIWSEQTLRRWPIESYRQLADMLIVRGYNIVIVGAESDAWITPYFERSKAINLIGKLSLIQLIKVFTVCSAVITHDSGPFHLAVFANNPVVVGLFGPTNEREVTYSRLAPIDKRKIITLWGGEHLNCRPCYYGKYYSQSCTNNLCMQDISAERVFEEVEKSLT